MGEKIDIVEVLLKKEYENDEIYDALDHILEENKKLKEEVYALQSKLKRNKR